MPKRTNTGRSHNTGLTAGTGDVPPLDEKSQQILAALADLGEATAAGLATHIAIGYSTTTPKLRKLNDYGLAVPGKAGNGQTVWRLTAAGRAHPAATSSSNNGATADDTDGAPPQDTATITESAGGVDLRTEQDVTMAASDGPDEAAETRSVDAPAAEADSADGAVGHGATADETALMRAGDLADGTIGETADDGTHNGDGAADAACDTPAAESVNGDNGPEPASENGGSDPAERTLNEATDKAADDAAVLATAPTGGAAAGKVRRPSGSLDKAVLAILQARPDLVFKVGELCRLINKAEAGTGMPPASPGAVVLAAQRLIGRHQAVLAVEKPASFQLMPGTAGPAAPTA